MADYKLSYTGKQVDDALGKAIKAVSTDPQTLSGEQKTQAIQNIGAAKIDDKSVTSKTAWSSQHIVDTLCPEFSVNGNPAVCYPVAGSKLGVKVSWEPAQAGEGNPSPDNIRPITGRDAVSVTRCGKNLLCPENKTQNNSGIKWTESKDGSFRIEGSLESSIEATAFYLSEKTKQNIYAAIKSGMTLAVSGLPTGVSIAVYDANLVGTGGATLKFPSGMGYPVNTYFEVRSLSHTFDGTYYPQIELGSTATPYEPYTGSTTDIALPETVYGGTLDVETGVVTVTHNVIDISQARFEDANTPAGVDWVSAYVTRRVLPGGDYTGDLISSHNVPEEYSKFMDVQGITVWYAPSSVGVAVPKSMTSLGDTPTNAEIIAAIRAVCTAQADAGTPVQICYKLVTPYAIQIDPQQIAALSGVNTLYTDAGTLTVTGRADPIHTINVLTNRVAALENATANG